MRRFRVRTLARLASATAFACALHGCSHTRAFVREPMLNGPERIAPDAIRLRLLLAGNAGAAKSTDPVIELLRAWAAEAPEQTLVVFLGDNVSPDGMPTEASRDRAAAEASLDAQVEVVRASGASALFLPGNHDWKSGVEGLAREEALITEELGERGRLVPSNGCPGPVAVDLDGLRLIAIDTEWWLESDGPCREAAPDAVIAEICRLIDTAGHRYVGIVGHHPLATHGTHGGFYDWKSHLFPLREVHPWLWVPLPVVGSLYPFGRALLRPTQDLSSRPYRTLIDKLETALRDRRPLFFAAAHERGLQILTSDAVERVLVSGAGSSGESGSISHGSNTLFAHAHVGFLVLDCLDDGRILLRVVEPGSPQVVYEDWLRNPG